MRKLTTPISLILSLLLFGATSAWSADFEKGWDAYNNEDYATALREWRPLAKQGHTPASKPNSHSLIRPMWPIVLDACE
jgi:hypothetical protein